MKLIGDLKKKVDEANTREEKQEIIKDAGMELTEKELEMVSGGIPLFDIYKGEEQ